MKAIVALLLIVVVVIIGVIPHANRIYDEIEDMINPEDTEDEKGE